MDSVLLLSPLFAMALRLANERDCRRFQFWWEQQLRSGLCCQGELLLCLDSFPMQRRDRAYEVASQLAEQTDLVVILCGKVRYDIAVDLRGGRWRTYRPSIDSTESAIVRKLRITLRHQPQFMDPQQLPTSLLP